MKFTILHPNDRIASIFKQAKSMVKKLPTDEMKQQWDKFVKNVTDKMNDTLQDQIEMLTFKLKDQEEKLTDLSALHSNLFLRNQELQAKLEAEWLSRGKHEETKTKLNEAERQIVDLKADLKIQCQNRDHFRALVAEQDTFITEIKKQIETYKTITQKELSDARAFHQTKIKEAEHLAQQAIRLTDENAKLTQKVNEIDLIKEKTYALIAENLKFKEQTTRLVQEKSDLQFQICCNTQPPCGGCFSCLEAQASHSISVLDTKLTTSQNDVKSYKNISALQAKAMGLLYPIVKKLNDKWFPPEDALTAISTYHILCQGIAAKIEDLRLGLPKDNAKSINLNDLKLVETNIENVT